MIKQKSIRKARFSDLKKIEEAEFSSGYHKERFNFLCLLKKYFKKREIILVAEKNKSVVGYVIMTKKGEIGFLAVNKKFQKKGIASSLLKKCEIIAKRKKLKKTFFRCSRR